MWATRRARARYGLITRTRPSVGPAPHRHVEVGDRGDHVLRGVGQAELRQLGEGLLDLGSRPQLKRPVLLGHGTLTAHRRLGDPASLLAGLAQQRGSRTRLAELA